VIDATGISALDMKIRASLPEI